jgi:hypothetical protein
MSTNGYFARSMWCSSVTSVDFGWYSSMVGTRPFAGPCACARVPTGRSIRNSTNNTAPLPTNGTRLRSTQLRDFIVTTLIKVVTLRVHSPLHSIDNPSSSHRANLHVHVFFARDCRTHSARNMRISEALFFATRERQSLGDLEERSQITRERGIPPSQTVERQATSRASGNWAPFALPLSDTGAVQSLSLSAVNASRFSETGRLETSAGVKKSYELKFQPLISCLISATEAMVAESTICQSTG